jgi:sulfur relay (sulfurtransferase) DsrF/TusC family protein
MPNTFVVSSAPSSGVNNLCRAVLGFRNLFESSNLVSPSSEDSDYPIELAYDYKTNTEYSPSITSGSATITIYQTVPSIVNYFGLFSKNAGDCELSFEVEVLNLDNGLYEEVGSRGSFANEKPQMIQFDDVLSTSQRITLYFTSKCYISALAIGEAVIFSRTVSSGYQPGRNASLDEVMNFSTDGNNFIQGRRITNGFQEKAPINYQPYSEIDEWWSEFMNHVLDSKQIFFMANNQIQTKSFYGLQVVNSLTKPSYKNSTHTDIDFEINGYAS